MRRLADSLNKRPGILQASAHRRGHAWSAPAPRDYPAPRRTVRGCDGTVEIDRVKRLVTKTYLHPDSKTALRNARRDAAYASRFFDALDGVEGVTCPRIVACEQSTPPRVVMELCPGEELSEFLLRMDVRDARIAHISGRIQSGLEVYIRLFGEPYYDFCFNNMLFDEDSGTLTFLDFVIPARPPVDSPETPLEASLGWLVGCTCYTLARPAFLFSSGAAYLALTQAVMTAFEGTVDSDRVYARARAVFSQMCDSGGLFRRKYYGAVGALITSSCLHKLRRRAA